jgi:tRNA (adenine22-N1)-methyltransferase
MLPVYAGSIFLEGGKYMSNNRLSKRLKTIADLAPVSDVIADIGTDHGFLAIYAVESGKAKKVYACDIAKKPLEQARDQINSAGVQERIETLLGPGLKPLSGKKVNGVVIAGMGGYTIKTILENDTELVNDLNFLVLQPQNNSKLLRSWLIENNERIVKERLVLENGFIYQILKAVKGKSEEYSEIELEYGKLEHFDEVELYKLNIKRDIQHYESIIKQMPKDKNNDIIKKRNDFTEKIDLLSNHLNSL